MSRKAPAQTPNDARDAAIDRPAVPAEILFLGVVLALTLFFTLAGIPGRAEKVAGDGSERLRRDWIEERSPTAAPDEHGTAPDAESGQDPGRPPVRDH